MAGMSKILHLGSFELLASSFKLLALSFELLGFSVPLLPALKAQSFLILY